MPGVFITFEGPDGAGKTTQVKVLQQHLEQQGKQVLVTREPGGTPLSEKIRALLLDVNNMDMESRTEALLYAAARAQHVEQKLKPAIAAGCIVLCDRFSDSTLAYQGYGRGINLEFLKQVNHIAENGLRPDLTLVFDLPSETGFERIQANRDNKDRLELMDLEFHQRVRKGFIEISQVNPNRCRLLDATKPVNEVTVDVLNVVQDLLASRAL